MRELTPKEKEVVESFRQTHGEDEAQRAAANFANDLWTVYEKPDDQLIVPNSILLPPPRR